MSCEACLQPSFWGICFSCVKARHKACMKRKCVCPKKLRRESKIKKTGSRSWISCERCLGQIKQLS